MRDPVWACCGAGTHSGSDVWLLSVRLWWAAAERQVTHGPLLKRALFAPEEEILWVVCEVALLVGHLCPDWGTEGMVRPLGRGGVGIIVDAGMDWYFHRPRKPGEIGGKCPVSEIWGM